jgi:hypothetical protein
MDRWKVSERIVMDNMIIPLPWKERSWYIPIVSIIITNFFRNGERNTAIYYVNLVFSCCTCSIRRSITTVWRSIKEHFIFTRAKLVLIG